MRRVMVDLDDDLREALRRQAAFEGKSMNEILLTAVREYLDRNPRLRHRSTL